MTRKITSILIAAVMVISLMPCAFAETVAEGSWGRNASWTLDSGGTLTISGEGEVRRSTDLLNYSDEIKKVVVEEGIVEIGSRLIYDMPLLTDLSLPSTLQTIESRNFVNCPSLTSLTIPAGLEAIDCDFTGCTALAAFDVDEANTSFKAVGGVVFNKSGDTLMLYPPAAPAEEYTVPAGVEELAENSFSSAYKLKKLVLPASVTRIECGFEGSESLGEIVLEAGNTSYVSDNGILFNTDKTELCFYPRTRAGAYTIPDTVAKMGYAAFEGNKFLTSVTIPESVKEIHAAAFKNCTALKEIEVPSTVTTLAGDTFNGCTALERAVINAEITELDALTFKDCVSLKQVVLPEGITAIGIEAFQGCSSLEEIALPKSVASIGDYAFRDCVSLEEFTFHEGITEIQTYAFDYCKNLKTIYLPSTVEYIGGYAFNGTDLEEVYYNGTEASWDNISIGGMNNPLTRYSTLFYTLKPTINGNPAYADGTVTVPLTQTSMNCILIAAAYKDNILLKVNSKTLAKDADSDSIGLEADGADTVAVYIWDKLAGLTPMCESGSIPIE